MNEQSRRKFIEKNKHLWGKVDPIDGIPYRPPEEPIKPLPQSHDDRNRSIYEEEGRSGLVVRVRWCGRLHYVGVFSSAKLARQARDQFEKHCRENLTCQNCGEKWTDEDERPICCLFEIHAREKVQENSSAA